MRIGENLPPWLQRIVLGAWFVAYGLFFIASVSAAWGWGVVGLVSFVALFVSIWDERKFIRSALAGRMGGVDKFFAIYLLIIMGSAIAANAALGLMLVMG